MQGGVVPGELPQGQAAAGAFGLVPYRAGAAMAQPGFEQGRGIGGGQQQQAVPRGGRRPTGRGQRCGQRRLQQAETVEQQSRGRQLLRHRHGRLPIVKIHHPLPPGHRLGGGHRQGGDQAIAAVGVVKGFTGLPLQPEAARFRFHGDHLQRQQLARIAQHPPTQRTDAAGATADEAAEAGRAPGAGGEPQGAPLQAQFLVEIGENAARLRHHDAAGGIQLPQAIEAHQVDHHTAAKGHTLAVVAGTRTPGGERHPMAGAGPSHRHHLLNALNPHHQLGNATRQQGRQHRRIVVAIARIAHPIRRVPQQRQAGILPLQLQG